MNESKIAARFQVRAAEGRAALVPYLTCGFPEPETTAPLLDAVASAGADVIELGIPFSDPLADGPTIQRSSFIALERGASVANTLATLRAFRDRNDTPVVLFTYLNPVLRYGLDGFCRDAKDAGADGVLITDLPTGADPEIEDTIRASGLDLIRLVAPTTEADRVPEVAESGTGFVYYISRTGVTGARAELRDELASEVKAIRDAVGLPVAVGFGISTPAQAAAVAGVAEGVVVGSALIKRVEAEGVDGAAEFIASLREAMDAS